MRPKHKNDLFQFLQKSKFGITRFEFFDSEEQTAIQFNKTPFRFVIKTSPRSFDHFEITYIQYAPDLPYTEWIPSPTEGYMNFEELKNYLWTWIERDLNNYLEDKDQPDLWEEFKKGHQAVTLDKIDFEDQISFSNDERKQIEMSINELKLLIHQNFNTSQEQQKLVDDRLNYLIDSTNRLNKFDWKSVSISTMLSIVTTLTLDVEKGRQLFVLFQKVFSIIPLLVG